MNTYTNAGPLPLSPVTASSRLSGTRYAIADRREEALDE